MKKDTAYNKIFLVFLKAFIFEIIITAIFVVLFGLFMFLTGKGFELAPLFATVSLGLGSGFAAYFAASKIGNKGLLNGFIIGITSFLIIALISLIVDDGSVTLNTLFHFIIFVLSALIGGVLGVNKRENKKFFR